MSTDPGAVARPVHTAFTVSVVPDLLVRRAALARKGLVGLILSIVISAAITGSLLMSYLPSAPLFPLSPGRLFVVVLMCTPTLYALGRLLVRIIRRHDLRRALKALVPGQVMRIERLGLVLRHVDRVELGREHV